MASDLLSIAQLELELGEMLGRQVDHRGIDFAVDDVQRRLAGMASSRPDVRVVDVSASDPYEQLTTALR